MTTRRLPQCMSCKHWVSPLDRGDGIDDTQTCAAFPAGIPDDIWWNRADHREPHPGDRGIRWESDGRDFPEWVLEPPRARAAVATHGAAILSPYPEVRARVERFLRLPDLPPAVHARYSEDQERDDHGRFGSGGGGGPSSSSRGPGPDGAARW